MKKLKLMKKNLNSLTNEIREIQNEPALEEEKRNRIIIKEGFAPFIRKFGEDISDMRESIITEELSISMRKTINPQSGALGVKLSDMMDTILMKNFKALIDQNVKDSKKEQTTKKVNNIIASVNSTLDDPLVENLTEIIPFASSIKGIVGTISGLASNIFDRKNLKPEREDNVIPDIKKVQKNVFEELKGYFQFYDKMANLDLEYRISLDALKSDLRKLEEEVQEFSFSFDKSIKGIDENAYKTLKWENEKTGDKKEDLNIRNITSSLSNVLESMTRESKTGQMQNHAKDYSNLSASIRRRTSSFFDDLKAIKGYRLTVNNEFQRKFLEVVEKANIKDFSEDKKEGIKSSIQAEITKLNNEIQNGYKEDKKEYRKYLDRIAFVRIE